MALETLLEIFERELPRLLQVPRNHGKHALIHGDQVDSLWLNADEALAAGYDRFGLDAFLIKEITEHEQPRYCSRNVTPCPWSPARLPIKVPSLRSSSASATIGAVCWTKHSMPIPGPIVVRALIDTGHSSVDAGDVPRPREARVHSNPCAHSVDPSGLAGRAISTTSA
jgi:hypothetical protein